MAEVAITISPALQSLPARLGKALDVAHEASGRATVEEVRSGIIQSGAIASFSLLRSVEKVFETRGAIKAWLIGSALTYASFANYGRKPGKRPPVNAIVKWIALKPIDTGGRDIRQVAFAIAAVIGKRGVKPKLFMERAMETATPRIEEIFTDELKRTISEG
jgi:hypothetical protein